MKQRITKAWAISAMGDGVAAKSASKVIAAKMTPPIVQGKDMRRIFQATTPKRMPTKRKAYPEMTCPPLSITPPCHLSGSRSVILEPERIDIIPRAPLMTAQAIVIRAARSVARRADGSSLIVGHNCTEFIHDTCVGVNTRHGRPNGWRNSRSDGAAGSYRSPAS
jgi:hypothetical protein